MEKKFVIITKIKKEGKRKMMIEPPIDELAAKTDDNKYKLCCVLSKRAKFLELTIPDELEASERKSISIAAQQLLDGEIVCSDKKED